MVGYRDAIASKEGKELLESSLFNPVMLQATFFQWPLSLKNKHIRTPNFLIFGVLRKFDQEFCCAGGRCQTSARGFKVVFYFPLK